MIYTIGHSTRPLAEFIDLLQVHAVRRLADVRTVPRSKRHPHFAAPALEASLAAVGIEYRHFPALGGLRKPRKDSANSAWRVEGFRGYADYMETAAFDRALESLLEFATLPTAVMCAEAVWWRCHRQLIADALVARGIDVRHITSSSPAASHTLTAFATVIGTEVRSPGPGVRLEVRYPGLV
ncbi:MAG: DUF488 family protein [Luteitalea sp.]|nr:DUF488 family protein [Luteitalea sp.]